MSGTLLEKFEKLAARVNSWYDTGPNKWLIRFKRFSGNPAHYFKYFFYQLSKKRPIFVRAWTFFGTKFYCYLPDYFWTWDLGILGDPSEIKLTRFLLKNLRKGDTLLDVGSNCGFYAALGGVLVGENGGVHAFEPTPKIFKMLVKNTQEFKNVFPVEAAVSDQAGEAEFYLNSLNTVANSLIIKPSKTNYKTTKVKVITLDDYCSTNNIRPSFIKLDVEGAEEAVVKGAKGVLSRTTPWISLEILQQDGGADFSAAEMLISLGYTPNRINENGDLEKISFADIVSSLSGKENAFEFENFIFKKPV